MFKKVTFILMFASFFGLSQEYIQNLRFTKTPLSNQDVGKPYEFDLTFDLVDLNNNPLSMGIGQFYYFITEVGDNSSFEDWPVSGFTFSGDYQNVANGFKFSFKEIQLKNKFPTYPSGNYKVLIMAYRGNNQWAFFGGYQNHINDYTFNFNFDDFCSDCDDGIYYGQDNDGDGLLEYYDDCPNESGPSSNNGCPIPTGSPDLTINKNNTTVSSGCLSCSRVLANISNDKYLLNPAHSMFVELFIENLGTASSMPSNVKFFLSSNSTLNDEGYNADLQFGPEPNVSSISQNSNKRVNVTFDYYTVSGILNKESGNSYILAVLDKDNFNPDEGDENNNVTAIPIRISSSTLSSKDFSITSIESNLNEEPYMISVYDFQGQKLLSKEVKNIEEENASTSNLSKGIYIIKSGKGDRKVYVNGN